MIVAVISTGFSGISTLIRIFACVMRNMPMKKNAARTGYGRSRRKSSTNMPATAQTMTSKNDNHSGTNGKKYAVIMPATATAATGIAGMSCRLLVIGNLAIYNRH